MKLLRIGYTTQKRTRDLFEKYPKISYPADVLPFELIETIVVHRLLSVWYELMTLEYNHLL